MRSMKRMAAVLAAVVSLVTAGPLSAHHSAAMFDDTKVVELSGTVKALQWTNPHIWLQVVVEDQGRADRMEPRRRQPELAVAPGLAQHDVQGRRRHHRAPSPDEGRHGRRQFHRREVRRRRPHDRELAIAARACSVDPLETREQRLRI